jgi:hypothetical protein
VVVHGAERDAGAMCHRLGGRVQLSLGDEREECFEDARSRALTAETSAVHVGLALSMVVEGRLVPRFVGGRTGVGRLEYHEALLGHG